MPSARRALIAGLGLIGGSIGMALRRAGWQIDYLDPAVTLEKAQHSGAADRRLDQFDAKDAAGHDLIILATPVDTALSLLEQAPAGSLVTTVCSVMAPFRHRAERLAIHLIAGHPLAGSQERGLSAAREDLFQDKTWFVEGGNALVGEMIAACGGLLHIADPAHHDEALALTSHLPQLLSTALAALLERQSEEDLTTFAGSGLRTFLRLAGSDVAVWKPILQANAANLLPQLEAITALAREMLEDDPESAFADANHFWTRLNKP